MRVLFICGDKEITAAVSRTLAEVSVEVAAADGVAAAERLPGTDAVLVWCEESRKMARSRRLDLLRLYSRVPVVVAMRLEDAPMMAESALVGDGVVFVDANLGRLPEIVQLTRAGYMLLPRDLTLQRLKALAEKRRDTGLDDLDRAVLAGLGEGLTDRQISQRLHVNEPTAKRLVHRLMRKLAVENRTRAAIFTRLLLQLQDSLRDRR